MQTCGSGVATQIDGSAPGNRPHKTFGSMSMSQRDGPMDMQIFIMFLFGRKVEWCLVSTVSLPSRVFPEAIQPLKEISSVGAPSNAR